MRVSKATAFELLRRCTSLTPEDEEILTKHYKGVGAPLYVEDGLDLDILGELFDKPLKEMALSIRHNYWYNTAAKTFLTKSIPESAIKNPKIKELRLPNYLDELLPVAVKVELKEIWEDLYLPELRKAKMKIKI